MKSKLKLAAITLVFLIGLILVFINPIQSFIINRLGDRLQDTTPNELIGNDSLDASFDFAAVETLTILDVLKAQTNQNALPVIGSIAIPSVQLQLPILKGVGRDSLAVGAGTMKPDQQMGKGNYSLAGHYFEEKDILFSPLYNLAMDEEIYIADAKNAYIYKVSLIDVIQATDVFIIDDVKNKDLLTLITCAEEGTKRLAIQADFVKRVPLESLDKKVFKKG